MFRSRSTSSKSGFRQGLNCFCLLNRQIWNINVGYNFEIPSILDKKYVPSTKQWLRCSRLHSYIKISRYINFPTINNSNLPKSQQNTPNNIQPILETYFYTHIRFPGNFRHFNATLSKPILIYTSREEFSNLANPGIDTSRTPIQYYIARF